MSRRAFAGLAAVAALAGCAVAPQGPSVLALPASGKSFAQFQQEDATCRNYAAQQSNAAEGTQQANNNALGSAAVGTLVGAGLGAALGAAFHNPGAGAAIGAGTGLAVGSSAGAANAQAADYSLQQRYDIAYTQCQYANGNSVQAAPGAPRGYVAYPAPGYPAPAVAYPAPYVAY